MGLPAGTAGLKRHISITTEFASRTISSVPDFSRYASQARCPSDASGPSRRADGPVMLESRPRARLSACESRVGGGVVGFKFLLASRSESLSSRVFRRWPSVGSARDGAAVCRAAPGPVTALLSLRAECLRP